MIREITIKGVTTFRDETRVDFATGINVIAGGNDTGKSHLMRLLYAVCRWMARSSRREFPEKWAAEGHLQRHLLHTFAIQQVDSLVSRHAADLTASVQAVFSGEKVPLGAANVAFQFGKQVGENNGIRILTMPERFLREHALYIPTQDVLSLYSCYAQVAKADGPAWDICRALESVSTEHLPDSVRRVLRLIHTAVHGKLQRGSGTRFFFQRGKEEPMELSLIAEGFKRLCVLGALIENGSLRVGDTLFWDEPEMNLNTTQLPILCGVMLGLCEAGVQIVMTTHSLFLLRELMIHLKSHSFREIPRRFIGLYGSREPGGTVQVQEGESVDDLDPSDSVQAELQQADRYLSIPDYDA